jgi:hypothetical protein
MTKPTFDDMWTSDFFQRHAMGALKKALNDYEDELVSNFERSVKQCESPLEAAFAAWWVALGHGRGFEVWLRHQVEVEAEGRTWRLDLVLTPTGRFESLRNHPLCPKIAIELDGHDFHERTKEQVARRNQRDRVLGMSGWTVWHISGSEFHANPEKVVWKTFLDATGTFHQALRASQGRSE